MSADGASKKLRSTIRRSTETGIAVEMRNRVTRQGSKESTDGSTNSNSSEGTWVERRISLNCSVSCMLLMMLYETHLCILLCLVYSVHCILSNRFIFPTTRLGPESQFSDFLDGLGPAQIVGRQTLATPPMGESRAQNLEFWIVAFITSRCGLHWHVSPSAVQRGLSQIGGRNVLLYYFW